MPNNKVGGLIIIKGAVPYDCARFDVNLQNGLDVYPREIPFHMSVRFNDPYTPKPVIVRAKSTYGVWGPEQRDEPCAFIKGSSFELSIAIDSDKFIVNFSFVNRFLKFILKS